MNVKLPLHVDNFLQYSRSPRRAALLVAALCILFLFLFSASSAPRHVADVTRNWRGSVLQSATSIPRLDDSIPYLRDARRPGKVIASPARSIDVSDSFEGFKRYPHCNTSSLELHDPFEPLCQDKESVLTAMTGGGRSGIDMPFIPRGCDMRWFDTAEICTILARYDVIHVVGDSMMRNLALALHQLIRNDLSNGPTQSWAEDPEGKDCFCHNAFENPQCWLRGAWSSQAVWENDPESMWCPIDDTAKIEFNVVLKWPLDDDGKGLVSTLPTVKPPKPHVFLFGHGLWNDVNETASQLWLNQVQENINKTMPWVTEPNAVHPRLYITPTCSGGGKPEKYLKTQGNPSLGRFELFMGPAVRAVGVDHLGVFNLTMQNTTPDGTHAGMHANLVKAMMVLNWLNWIDVSNY